LKDNAAILRATANKQRDMASSISGWLD